jgi:aspartyl/asparaginyl beta-hydroxylase (cupin superfamily)
VNQASPQLEADADRAAASGDLRTAVELLEQAISAGQPNPTLWTKLGAMRRATGDLKGALDAVDKSLALAPLDFSALLARAMLLEKLNDPAAGEAFSNAIAMLPPNEKIPGAMAAAIEHAKARASQHAQGVEQRLLEAMPRGLDETRKARLSRFASNISKRTRHYHQEPTDFHYPGLPEIEFHDRGSFPELAGLEAATDVIRAEFQALIAAEAAQMVPYIQYPERVPLRQWKELNNNRDWTAIHLLQNGKRVEANARHCPETMEAIAKLPQPDVPGASPNAMFSMLAPHTRIPPHTGVANTRLVCHLPLIVPDGCGFRCGATTCEWHVGKTFVFDDTIEHEAWNDSGELRVVLIVDLWPPALDTIEREGVAKLIGATGVSFVGA